MWKSRKKKKALSETYEIHRTNNHKLKIILASRTAKILQWEYEIYTYDCAAVYMEEKKSMRMQVFYDNLMGCIYQTWVRLRHFFAAAASFETFLFLIFVFLWRRHILTIFLQWFYVWNENIDWLNKVNNLSEFHHINFNWNDLIARILQCKNYLWVFMCHLIVCGDTIPLFI